MKNWSISFKLLCLVAIAIVAFVCMGLYGILNTRSIFGWVSEVNTTAKDFQRSAKEISGGSPYTSEVDARKKRAPFALANPSALCVPRDPTFSVWIGSSR